MSPRTDPDLLKMLNAALRAAIAATDADFGNIQIVDSQDGGLRIAAQHGFGREFLNFFRYVREDKSACSAALRAGRRTIVTDVRRSRIYTESARRTMLAAKARACQSTPIVAPDGRVLGIISTHFRVPHRPTRTQLALVDQLAQAVADSMDVRYSVEAARDAADTESPTIRGFFTNGSHERGRVRVLVAEADDDTRSVFGESLKRAGCDVVDAADGRDALAKALSTRPTLVITETRLPVFDGYALCEVLRRDAATRAVPIIAVTTETRAAALDRARAAGVDAVLNKPVTADRLLKEIQQLLERSDPSKRLDVGCAGRMSGERKRRTRQQHRRKNRL